MGSITISERGGNVYVYGKMILDIVCSDELLFAQNIHRSSQTKTAWIMEKFLFLLTLTLTTFNDTSEKASSLNLMIFREIVLFSFFFFCFRISLVIIIIFFLYFDEINSWNNLSSECRRWKFSSGLCSSFNMTCDNVKLKDPLVTKQDRCKLIVFHFILFQSYKLWFD